MKKYIFILFISFFLTGCMTYQERMRLGMRPYMGMSYRHLIAEWGIPNTVFPVDNQTVLIQYQKHSTLYAPGQPYSADITHSFNSSHISFKGEDPLFVTKTCTITFQIFNDTVNDYKYEGDCSNAFPKNNPVYQHSRSFIAPNDLTQILLMPGINQNFSSPEVRDWLLIQ